MAAMTRSGGMQSQNFMQSNPNMHQMQQIQQMQQMREYMIFVNFDAVLWRETLQISFETRR